VYIACDSLSCNIRSIELFVSLYLTLLPHLTLDRSMW